MRRTVSIFLIVAICVSVFAIRQFRMRMAEQSATLAAADAAEDSADVAATLRSLSSEQSDEAPKAWATRFAAFVNDHPGRQWVVGRCERPALSESEAAESARADASRKLFPLVARSMGDRVANNDPRLHNLVNQHVRSARLEADRFAEQFDRPYGKVWTESVLLDVSADKLAPIFEQYRQQAHFTQLQSRRHTAAAGAVIIVTLLACLSLNVITKGYFAMRLQIAAAVIVAVALMLLV